MDGRRYGTRLQFFDLRRIPDENTKIQDKNDFTKEQQKLYSTNILFLTIKRQTK